MKGVSEGANDCKFTLTNLVEENVKWKYNGQNVIFGHLKRRRVVTNRSIILLLCVEWIKC